MTNIFPDNFELPPPTCAFLATKARMTKRRKDKGTKMPIRKTMKYVRNLQLVSKH